LFHQKYELVPCWSQLGGTLRIDINYALDDRPGDFIKSGIGGVKEGDPHRHISDGLDESPLELFRYGIHSLDLDVRDGDFDGPCRLVCLVRRA
jgi:hypothetical protein